MARVDHGLDLAGVGLPMGEEDAGRARHGEEIGVGRERVLAYRVVLLAGATVLCVVVLHKRHGIASVCLVAHQGLRVGQLRPVATIDGVAYRVAEREVEGRALLLRTVYPGLHLRDVAIEILAYGIGHVGRAVVVGHVRPAKALHHVVAKTAIAEVLHEVLLVGLDHPLHVGTLVVEVAHAVPVFALVLVAAKHHSLPFCLGCRLAVVVVGRDVGRLELVGRAAILLLGEGEPATRVVVVDHDVGQDTHPVLAHGPDHRPEFCLATKTGVLVEVVIGCVAHHVVVLQTLSALGHP